MSTYKIFLRSDNKNIDGTNTLYLLFTSNRVLKKFSLKINVFKKDWNEQKCIVKKTDADHLRKNKYIRKYSEKAQKIIDTYFFNDKPLSISEFERNFKNTSFGSTSFYDFIENEMKTLIIEEGTRKNYLKQISKLKSFKKELLFTDIDLRFLKNYNYFLKTERNNNDNTRKASMNFLRQVINKARKQEITDINPFLNYAIGTIKGTKESLTKSEIDKLENLLKTDILKPNEKTVLEYFLFDCYTGLRVSDLKAIQYKNIETDVINSKEYKFLVYTPIKTKKYKKVAQVPLMPFSEKFIKPCKFPNKPIFKIFTGQGTNRVLKRIMNKANINKHITIHCGRYTFISIGSELGIRGEIMQSMVKHSKIEETMGYLNVSRTALVEEMEKFNK